MRMLICGLALSLGSLANDVNAAVTVNVDGVEYPLSVLTENCNAMAEEPQAMIACFNELSALLESQSEDAKPSVSPAQALADLQAVAQYQDNDSGLLISGAECNIHIVYFDNYFHISRRNVSSIDLFSAKFDASKLQYDQVAQVPGSQAPLFSGLMDAGATAETVGGVALESKRDNFEAKAARSTMDVYANEVVGQLPASRNQAFNFVLVHPERNPVSADIWNAMETYVAACRG